MLRQCDEGFTLQIQRGSQAGSAGRSPDRPHHDMARRQQRAGGAGHCRSGAMRNRWTGYPHRSQSAPGCAASPSGKVSDVPRLRATGCRACDQRHHLEPLRFPPTPLTQRAGQLCQGNGKLGRSAAYATEARPRTVGAVVHDARSPPLRPAIPPGRASRDTHSPATPPRAIPSRGRHRAGRRPARSSRGSA